MSCRSFALLALVVLGAACGAPTPPPVIESFTAAPAMLPYGGGSTTLSWKVTGADEVRIAPDVGAVQGESTQVTVSSPTTFTLTAKSAEGEQTAAVTVTVSTVATIAGQVVDRFGSALANVTVEVSGKPTVVTDEDGRFSVADVTPPYDLTLVNASKNLIYVYQGLRAASPRVQFGGAGTARSANVSGTLTGGAAAGTFGLRTMVVGSIGASSYWNQTVDVFAGTHSGDANWFGPQVATAGLYALQWTVDANEQPVSYTGYGAATDLTLPSSGTVTADVRLEPVAAKSVGGTVQAPPGFAVQRKLVSLTAGAFRIPIAVQSGASPVFAFLVPDMGGPLSIEASASRGGESTIVRRVGLLAGRTDLQLEAVPPPQPVSPVDGGTGVNASTRFAWIPFDGGLHIVEWTPDSSANAAISVVTTASEVTFPDLSRFGISIPAGQAYTWQLTGAGPFSSTDDAVTGLGLGAIFRNDVDVIMGRAASRGFTTGP